MTSNTITSSETFMQIVCKLTLTMQDKSCLNVIFVDGCPGAQSAMSYQGFPEAHTEPGASPRGREFRSTGGSRNSLGSSLHSESPLAAASSPPTWQWGCSATSASPWLCPERSHTQIGHRETHSSHSAGKTLYVATVAGRDGLAPKTGDGELPGWAVQDGPTHPFSLALASGAGQAPTCTPALT